MDFGASMFFTDYSMTSVELARAPEARGLKSVWGPRAFAHPRLPSFAFPPRWRAAKAILRRHGPVSNPTRFTRPNRVANSGDVY
jgi:hypothetical protein